MTAPVVRPATAHDLDSLWSMLALAADWRPGTPVRSVEAVRRDPQLARYLDTWPCDGEQGVVAEMPGPFVVGAAWWRRFDSSAPGYGFVDQLTPEVSIAVHQHARRRGVGRALLDALIGEARRAHLPALSLSVEADNPAVTLYRSVGFREVSDGGGAVTMLLDLGAARMPFVDDVQGS